MKQAAHQFRGEYIDLCARIEQWAMEVFNSNAARDSGGIKGKVPHLFGLKLKLATELANMKNPIFSKPERVVELMAQVSDYAQLRSELAHATIRVAGQGDEAIFAFNVPAERSFPHGSRRFWLTPSDTTRILGELRQIVKQICDQKVKSTS